MDHAHSLLLRPRESKETLREEGRPTLCGDESLAPALYGDESLAHQRFLYLDFVRNGLWCNVLRLGLRHCESARAFLVAEK